MSNLFTTKPLAEMSLEQLKKQGKSFITVSRVMSVILLVLLLYYFIHLYQKGWGSGSTGSLAGFSALTAAAALQLKKIRAEISQRTGVL